MMKAIKFLIILILSSQLIGQCVLAANKKAASLDRIIAVVDDSVITQSELDQAIDTAKRQILGSGGTLPPDNVLHKQVLDQLINKKLQFELADRSGVKITDAEIDKAISTIAAGHQISVKELYEKVSAQGLSLKNYRKEIQNELTLQAVQHQAITTKITVTPEEVTVFMRSKPWQAYNAHEYHLEDLLISLPEPASPQQIADTKKRAQELLTIIRNGKSFQETAASDPSLQSSDLGWRKMQEIPTAFANEIMQRKPNEVFGPIQTANGFHIVRLIDVRTMNDAAKPGPTRQQAQQFLYQRKFEEAVQGWLTKLRGEAFIKINPEN